jgi:tight adherence protein B
MLIAAGLAWGLWARVPLVVLAATAVAIYQPLVALVALVAFAVVDRARSDRSDDEGAFLQAVAAELRAGAAVRVAIAEATDRVPSLRLDRAARLARAGRPLDELAVELASKLPRNGRLTAAAVRIAGSTGGRIAGTFDELALLASEDMELRGETRAATAQARLSAWIVAGIPVVYLAYAAASGRLSALVDAGGVGIAVLGVGGVLLVGGVLAIVVTVRKTKR